MCHWHCQPPLQGLNHVLLQLLIFKTPWNKFRVERTGKIGLQIIRYFQEPIFWAHSYISSIYKSTKTLHSDDCSLWLAVILCKKYVWLLVLPFHQSYIYTDLLPRLFVAFSQSYLKSCLQSYSPHFGPPKRFNSQLSCCALLNSTCITMICYFYFLPSHVSTNSWG